MRYQSFLSLAFPAFASAQSGAIVSLPYELTYLLPRRFNSTLPGNVPNIGNVTSTFVGSTRTSDAEINRELRRAAAAPIISYSQEFLDLVGPDPDITLVEERPGELFAFEGTVWIPSRNEVWFTSAFYDQPGYLSILHLRNGTVTRPPIPNGFQNFQRGVYDATEDRVYFTSFRGVGSYRGGLLRINPSTYETEIVFNSYFGLPFNGLNDITWGIDATDGSRSLYVSDIDFLGLANPEIAPSVLYPGLYRWDLKERTLEPALTRGLLPVLNAAKISPDLRTLYISEAGNPASGVVSSQAIYRYDLDDAMRPGNQRLFSVPRFFLDGFQVDDAGRVWAAEGDGIVVRNARGRILGVFNKTYFARENLAFGNLGLAGNKLVVLAGDRIWTVKLAQQIVTRRSRHLFG